MSNDELKNITLISSIFMSFSTMGSLFTFGFLIFESKVILGIILLFFLVCMFVYGYYLYYKSRWEFHSTRIKEINGDLIPKIKHWKYDVNDVRWQKYIKIEINKINKIHNIYKVIFTILFLSSITLFFYNKNTSLFFLFFIFVYAFNYFYVGLNYRESKLRIKALKSQKPEIIITFKGILISKTHYISLNEDGIYLRKFSIINYKNIDNVMELERVTPYISEGAGTDEVIFHFYLPIPTKEKIENKDIWLNNLFFEFHSSKKTFYNNGYK